MEALLSVAFDNISSRDSGKIRKGLRQIEGLLAQICLSKSQSPQPAVPRSSPNKRKSSALSPDNTASPKTLRELGDDPAFREFFRLQDGFEWNVASRLTATLERLMGMGNPGTTDLLILSTLTTLHGALLLHPPSRTLFSRESAMNLVLDLLDPSTNPPKVQSQALLVLVTALLDCPRNTRVFEQIDGLLTLTSLFKSRAATREVKVRSLEVLYFYLMPETPLSISQGQEAKLNGSNALVGVAHTAQPVRNPRRESIVASAFAGHARTHSGETGAMDVDYEGGTESNLEPENPDARSMEEKQRLLGKYLNNVAELVQDLNEGGVLGVVAA